MNNITILSNEQIFGEDRLDIFKKYGANATITDFAILLGGFNVSFGNSLEDRTSYYWTKSLEGDGHVRVIFNDATNIWGNPYERDNAIRLASQYSHINLISKDVVSGSPTTSEIEYGEYPQKAVNKELKNSLEKEYRKSRLKTTGKVYTTDSRIWNKHAEGFLPKEHVEQEYEGKRYVRVKSNLSIDNTQLSNGSIVENGDYVWVEVEPITWLVDEKTGIIVSKKLLFSGVRFDGKDKYDGDFESTEMKKFIDNYFSKEIEVIAIKAIEPTPEKEFETEEELDEYISFKLAEARKRLTLLGKK